jgi:hypothetical protein
MKPVVLPIKTSCPTSSVGFCDCIISSSLTYSAKAQAAGEAKAHPSWSPITKVFKYYFVSVQVYIAVLSFMEGDGRRLLFGYDSFGNTCHQKKNTPIPNLTLSGLDTDGLP